MVHPQHLLNIQEVYITQNGIYLWVSASRNRIFLSVLSIILSDGFNQEIQAEETKIFPESAYLEEKRGGIRLRVIQTIC
jgi:hypothetical protein